MRSTKPFFFVCFILYVTSAFAADSFIEYKPDQIAVKLSAGAFNQLPPDYDGSVLTGISDLDALLAKHKSTRFEAHFTLPENRKGSRYEQTGRWFKVRFPEAVEVLARVEEYAELPSVEQATAIPIHALYRTTDDPDVSSQWHIDQLNDADIDAPEAWDIQTGNESVIVALMDTGVEWFHQDLGGTLASEANRGSIAGNMWINVPELTDTSSTTDEDNNGFNDDWVGWDFVDDVNPLFNMGDDYDIADNDPRDHEGHGTHCAGNVGAINNNGFGISSIAGGWGEDAGGMGNGVRVMALRIGWSDFPSGRVSMDFAAQAFLYAEANGARIASCSWGNSDYAPLVDAVNIFLYGTETPQPEDPQLRLIFVAAGNDGTENADYLSTRDDVISVSATKQDDDAATSFTTYGTWVDICAPGVDIYSLNAGGGYASWSGTSMATPIAAGVSALIWSHDPDLLAGQVENYLYDGSDNIDDKLTAKYLGKMGAGRVSAYGSLALLNGPANQPPVAVDDTLFTEEDSTSVFSVLKNDTDADGDTIRVLIADGAVNGTISYNDTSVTYAPYSNFFGTDSFSYIISDEFGLTDTAMARITVASRNDAPVITGLPDDLALEHGTCQDMQLMPFGSDSDTPDSLLTWEVSVDNPAAISAQYNEVTDTLTICSLSGTGDYFVFVTLRDDSNAVDQDTIAVHVDMPSKWIADKGNTVYSFNLMQNYPNPFNPQTAITYTIATESEVNLTVFNARGQQVATLVNSWQRPGIYSVRYQADHLSSGVYFYRLRAGSFTRVRKMIYIR